jgi:low affinity Fe/Cu permease
VLIVSEGSRVAQTREQSTQTFFDRFAGRWANFVSRAPFFTFCVLLVVLWAPTYFLVGNFDTYQLIINTPTTIITFLLVALLPSSSDLILLTYRVAIASSKAYCSGTIA